MPETILVIGDKKKSSWSLRPWLFLRHHGVTFREVPIRLDTPETRAQILKYSPSGRVPCLVHGSIKVWESLAICEQAVELFKLRDAWPVEPEFRALARSLAMEMHAGFAALRQEFPFDATRIPQTQAPSPAAAADIQRIRQIWRDTRTKQGKDGDWLFGKFGIVDAMYAPVAVRLHKYNVPLDGPERDYVKTVLAMPALREWLGAALLEADVTDEEAPRPPDVHVEPPLARTLKRPKAQPAAAAAAAARPATPGAPSPLERAAAAMQMQGDLEDSELPPAMDPRKPAAAAPPPPAPPAKEAPLQPGQIRSKIIPP